LANADVFGDYGRYYDVLYADKDYAAEGRYVVTLLEKYVDTPRTILEFGSGTGRHGRVLARHGYHVTGIERSQEMIQRAAEAPDELGDLSGSFRCVQGDIRSTSVRATFDAVISLFHVVSYQTESEDVAAVFKNAARHLKSGGLFLFDVWYAPAVLTLQPAVRVRRVEDERFHVTRTAEPVLLADRNCVQVNYTLFVRDKQDETIRTLSETHLMRYFSTPEIEWLGQNAGLSVVAHEEWLTGRPPSTGTWGVCYVVRKRGAGSRKSA
jgi:SAM-dependent methyltransferase